MTVAVDFDGVIHRYSRGWHDGSIYDDPMPGALEGLRVLMEQDAVFVHTSRDATQVGTWLKQHDFDVVLDEATQFWDVRGMLLVTNRKLAALCYIDDRAIRFQSWPQALADVEAARAA